MRRKQLGLALLVLSVSLLALAPAAQAQHDCNCGYCRMFPSSPCIDYSDPFQPTWNCALYVFDPLHGCLPAQARTASPSEDDLLARIFQPESAATR